MHFKTFSYSHILKNCIVDAIIDFLNFAWGEQGQKSPLNIFIKTVLPTPQVHSRVQILSKFRIFEFFVIKTLVYIHLEA